MSGRRGGRSAANNNVGANSIVYSGRGRPAKSKETVDRPLPVGIVLGTPSPGSDIFKNRKIRVGGPFQAKVPKKPLAGGLFSSSHESSPPRRRGGGGEDEEEEVMTYESERPAPFRVSMIHPHLTQDQVDEYEKRQQLLLHKQQQQQQQREKDTISYLKQPTTNEGSAMEIDTSLTQTTTTTTTTGTEEGTAATITSTSTTTTTTTTDSSSMIVSPKMTTTDRQRRQQQQQQESDANSNNSDGITSPTTTITATASYKGKLTSKDKEEEGYLETTRGGLLVYQPPRLRTPTEGDDGDDDDDDDDFWKFLQPLLMSAPRLSSSSATDDVGCGGGGGGSNSSPLNNKSNNNSNNNNPSWEWQIHEWYVDQERKRQQAEERRKEELEQQRLLELQQQEQMPRRRGRRKRKKVDTSASSAAALAAEDILDWYDDNFGCNNNNSNGNKNNKKAKLEKDNEGGDEEIFDKDNNNDDEEEDRAHAMQHLWLRHQGNASMAKVETLVQLSAGSAEAARKVRHHKRRRAYKTMRAVTWREYCEQSTPESLTGDFRGDAASAATNNTTKKATSKYYYKSSKSKSDKVCNLHTYDDIKIHQDIWKSILKCGQSIEECLNKASTGSKRYTRLLNLSTLTSFLNNAYLVRPLPEDVFRASDIPPAINECFDNIADYVDQARKVQAQLMDLLYETNDEGVDLDAVNKLLDQSRRYLALELDDARTLQERVELWLEWQKRLDSMVAESDLCLASLEELAKEGQSFSFRTKSLVCLENRIQKAHQLRDRIVEWRKACTNNDNQDDDLDDKKECVKFLLAMVRDANRLKLSFPEVSDLRETHRSVEAWIDRANIAIRSRISLTEIKALIERGENMPVDLTDSMEKLRARENLAEDWINKFEEVVPRPNLPSGPGGDDADNESEEALLLWMRGMRNALNKGKYAVLHDIAFEGSRIPVEVDIVKLLQLELDAQNWTTKAKKWTPSLSEGDGTACKRAKLDDLREHLGKGAALRERLDLSASAKENWTLDGEAEIRAIVQAADDWFVRYKPYLDWDNRRSLGRSCLSLDKLRTIVNEGNAIHANIGNAIGKMTRILAQAEGWVKEHEPLLLTCKIIPQAGSDVQPMDKRFVTLEGMTAVAKAAGSDVSLDLDEAKELLKLVDVVKDWTNRVGNAAPKRSGRGRGRKAKFTVEDIIALINEAANIPVDTTADVNRLQIQLSGVQEWRAKAREKLEEIAYGFLRLRHVVDDMYGGPSEYSRVKADKVEASDEVKSDAAKSEMDGSEEKKVTEDTSMSETASSAASEQDSDGIPNFGNGNCNVNQLIKVYRREAKNFGVASGEVEAAEQLEKVSNWCVKSLKYLVNQRDVFDKRFFGAFDRFVGEGRELLKPTKSSGRNAKIRLEDEAFTEKLNSSWTTFVSDQLQRLDILVADREQFISWCNMADTQLFSGDKRPSLEKLKDVSDRSRAFPAVCDMVQKVRGQYNRALEWKESTKKLLNGKEKLCPPDAKNILDSGEKLGFACEEMKTLRNALRAARNWANRYKRCNVEQGSANLNAVQALIDDHDALLLEMPEELSMLQQAMQSYCLCRRPYSGFMIGCDECEEWYHGNCIGITESKADRFDKYVCIRCSLSRVFKNTAKDAVGLVRKWTCPKDMKKARQVEAQKHQRKVRKETKDIEKLQAEIQALEASQADQGGEQGLFLMNGIPGEAAPFSSMTDSALPNEQDQSEENPVPSVPKLSPEEAQAKIGKAQETIRQCEERLARLSEKSEERKAVLCVEYSKAALLKNWCLRVRSLVLVPRTDEAAEASRPLEDGSLSASMQSLIEEAKQAGIASVSDVEAMINAFRCMSWCLLATKILSRKPTVTEFEMLVTQAKGLKLTEEKSLRTIKSILLRGKAWQSKVMKALAPLPGETKSFNLENLKELQATAEEIPLLLKEEALLSGVIDDDGARHCTCRGPTDARFMLSCDKCEKWFHGPCVNMTKEKCDALQKWVCPPCKGSVSPVPLSKCGIIWEDRDDPRQAKKRHTARDAPDPVKMWPPFGLFDSEKAREVLGEDCRAISDVGSTTTATRPEAAPSVSAKGSVKAGRGGRKPAASKAAASKSTTGKSAGSKSVASKPAASKSVPSKPAASKPASIPAAIKETPDTATAVPPTTLVQSADVSQELHMPLSQGFQPPNCGLLADTDADTQPQAPLATSSSLKSTIEFSQQQAFQWLAQSGAAAALAATQVNLAQSQAQAFGWQPNPFAVAAAAASLSCPPSLTLGHTLNTNETLDTKNSDSETNNNTNVNTDANSSAEQLSALETLAQMANNQQVANEVQNPEASPVGTPFPEGASSEIQDQDSNIVQITSTTTVQSSACTQFLGAAPETLKATAAAAAEAVAEGATEQPELPSAQPQLNPTALNLIVAALPVQESGS